MLEIIAGLAAIVVGLFIKGSFQRSKIEDLEEEKQAAEKVIKLKAESRKAEYNAQVEEEIAINGMDDNDWRNKI
jgi:hypothetical protein